MADESKVEVPTALWTVELPRARVTRWHQTFQELTAQVGQQLGLAMTLAQPSALDVHVEIDILGGQSVRVGIRCGETEFVSLDAHVETSQ